jgi:predicted nicotinamide N-methyase
MKKRAPVPKPLWDEIYFVLIEKWRKLLKLPLGPADRLQTREFRSLIDALLEYKESNEIDSPETLGAYLMYEWPLHYAQGLSLLQEIQNKPDKVLDLGTLGAPFSLAALQHGATEVIAIGENERALKHGADLSGHLGYPISIRVADPKYPKLLNLGRSWDLIILSYSLFRNFSSQEAQMSYINQLLPLLSEDGHLLIVEDSITDVNKKFLSLRDQIASQNLPILAPCLWKGDCPALKHGSSPCFAQRPLVDKPFMIKEIQRAAKINLNSLKMSYLILRSPLFIPPKLQDNLYRVVSPAVNTFRGERYFLCGVSGKATLGTTLKEHPKQSKAFEYLKRGDVISIEDAVKLQDDMQVVDKTVLQLKAPCDKPLQ